MSRLPFQPDRLLASTLPVKISSSISDGCAARRTKAGQLFGHSDMYFRSEKNKMEKVPFTFFYGLSYLRISEITFLPLPLKI
jgi:hypothetical protein